MKRRKRSRKRRREKRIKEKFGALKLPNHFLSLFCFWISLVSMNEWERESEEKNSFCLCFFSSHSNRKSLFVSDVLNQQENKSLVMEKSFVGREMSKEHEEMVVELVEEAQIYRVQSRSQLIVTSSHKIHGTRKWLGRRWNVSTIFLLLTCEFLKFEAWSIEHWVESFFWEKSLMHSFPCRDFKWRSFIKRCARSFVYSNTKFIYSLANSFLHMSLALLSAFAFFFLFFSFLLLLLHRFHWVWLFTFICSWWCCFDCYLAYQISYWIVWYE